MGFGLRSFRPNVYVFHMKSSHHVSAQDVGLPDVRNETEVVGNCYRAALLKHYP